MERKHNSILTAVLIPLFALALMLGLGRYVGTAQAQSAEEVAAPAGGEPVTLTLLHNNDGESSLLPFETEVGTETLPLAGVAAFKTLTDEQIADAESRGNAVVNVYAGDAFLASATLACSLPPQNEPIYDAIAQRQIAYDAHIIGNHEFDYSPDFLERFIRTFEVNGALTQPFLSSNLDFSGEPGFADLIDDNGVIVGEVTDGRVIAHSLVMTDAGGTFGIVGATTWTLPTISSPRNVTVTANITDTANVVQSAIDLLYDTYGVRKIIFVSHLQDVNNDKALITLLDRVDVAVAGGGDELLVNQSQDQEMQLLPGEQAPIQGDYPTVVQDASGRNVYLVTTAGNYKYLGRLDVVFDAGGEVTTFNDETSYPRRVIPQSDASERMGLEDAVVKDPGIVETVEVPVTACLEEFDEPIARTEIPLDVSRNTVRGAESNGGNLIADSFLYVYEQYSNTISNTMQLTAAGAGDPAIAVQNGGGIRQNAGDVLTGTISRLDTLNVLPFDNRMTVVQDVTPEELEAILERSAESLPGAGGQFLQIAGFRVVYNSEAAVGNRVMSATLEDGTPIIENYETVDGAPNVDIVTNNFTANGGDNYPTFAAMPQERKPPLLDENGFALTYEQPLVLYLQTFPVEGDPALPTIQEDDPRYQLGGEGRITIITEPTAVTVNTVGATPGSTLPVWLLAGAGLALSLGTMAALHRRRR